MILKKIIIAIDGFSSCGKSTLARELAQELEYIYIDSGAMYRAMTLYAIENNLISDAGADITKIEKGLNSVNISFVPDKDYNPLTILNGREVERQIRNIEVSSFVSEISKIASVRRKMVALQRDMGKNKGIVMDGRDIGTVVFPNAELKLFITADIDVRAKRRYDELVSKNMSVSLDEIRNNIAERDRIDQSRSESPLKKADDAIIIDNSNLTREEQLEKALGFANQIINAY